MGGRQQTAFQAESHTPFGRNHNILIKSMQIVLKGAWPGAINVSDYQNKEASIFAYKLCAKLEVRSYASFRGHAANWPLRQPS
jgi:hypothetical protein